MFVWQRYPARRRRRRRRWERRRDRSVRGWRTALIGDAVVKEVEPLTPQLCVVTHHAGSLHCFVSPLLGVCAEAWAVGGVVSKAARFAKVPAAKPKDPRIRLAAKSSCVLTRNQKGAMRGARHAYSTRYSTQRADVGGGGVGGAPELAAPLKSDDAQHFAAHTKAKPCSHSTNV